ncbi:HNH endonuclease [Microcella frigidaquae]|uniref:5-methylcytosine-specific restriction endonuclease McrA n=1 Tax=Microcella frigidaquae TaxID=424758 RepID=A0A840X327_9MICO|nr:5-methylcytosine-specific restriction endonuclease McrA [Microcella frigidaquae]
MPHPNSRQARAARRRRTRVAAADNDLTPTQWAELQALWGGCAYCGATDRPLQRDCVQPITRGGRYTLDNVVPACGSCNASKSNDEVTSWMRRTRRDERAFLERLVAVRAALGGAAADGVEPVSETVSESE